MEHSPKQQYLNFEFEMDSPFSLSFEAESFNVFYKLHLVLQGLQDVLKNIEEVIEKFADILKVFVETQVPKTSTLSVNHNRPNKNHSNSIADSIEHPTVRGLHEIAGLENIKNVLHMLVILPRLQPQLFQNRSISNTILLYGPPGTGKTRLVHGLAAESSAMLHAISVGNLLSSYVGETEKNIKNIFDYLRTSEHFSILFIDEIDSICRKRTSSELDYSRRIKTELMSQMTKIELCQNMVIIAATNCPWDLDSAILRRFQKRLYVPLPNCDERLELFQLLTKDTPIIQTPEQLAELIQLCEGYSGSDICALVHDALDIPLTELQHTTIWNKTADGFYEPFSDKNPSIQNIENICINKLNNLPAFSVRARSVAVSDFLEAAKHIQLTVTSEDLDKYEHFQHMK